MSSFTLNWVNYLCFETTLVSLRWSKPTFTSTFQYFRSLQAMPNWFRRDSAFGLTSANSTTRLLTWMWRQPAVNLRGLSKARYRYNLMTWHWHASSAIPELWQLPEAAFQFLSTTRESSVHCSCSISFWIVYWQVGNNFFHPSEAF